MRATDKAAVFTLLEHKAFIHLAFTLGCPHGTIGMLIGASISGIRTAGAIQDLGCRALLRFLLWWNLGHLDFYATAVAVNNDFTTDCDHKSGQEKQQRMGRRHGG